MTFEYFVTRGGAPDHRGHACDALPDGDDWELVGPAQPMPVSKREELNDYDRATGVDLIECELVWTWRRRLPASTYVCACNPKSQAARIAAETYVREHGLSADLLARRVEDALLAVGNVSIRKSARSIVSRRCKKNEKSTLTVMGLLVLAFRWRNDFGAGTAAVRAMCERVTGGQQ